MTGGVEKTVDDEPQPFRSRSKRVPGQGPCAELRGGKEASTWQVGYFQVSSRGFPDP